MMKVTIMKAKFPKVRVMKTQKATYSIENPNPEWKIKGEKWINFALFNWKEGKTYDVAYIPHIPLKICKGMQVHDVIPISWDLEEVPNASNFYMGGGNNKFRLNARYKNPANLFIGSRKNVDLSPSDDKEAILELMKLAERIYDPPVVEKDDNALEGNS